MVQCFAPDCNHQSESQCADFLGEKCGWIQEVDWFIEVREDFVFIYYFKLKNTVRPKVRYVCTIDCNSGGHITRSVFVTFKYVFMFRLVITVSLSLTVKVFFSKWIMKRKTKKEKKKSQPRGRLYSMYARSDRGCKGELAQSQQVPERSEWSSTKEIVSLEAELKQAKREITDLKEKIG